MTILVALVSAGKGSWAQVNALLQVQKWDKVFLLCNEYSMEKFETKGPNIVKVPFEEKNAQKNYKKLSDYFKKEVNDFEVALNLSSGTGLEHMAVLSALLRSGLGIRLVYVDFGELKEFTILDGPMIPEDEDLF